ncbi:MAG TPA: hypothetical protein VNV88_11485, partial [Candidatus Solibacter sp.]|nr:hypothetical protein [Candidatus Solibacter sp.]
SLAVRRTTVHGLPYDDSCCSKTVAGVHFFKKLTIVRREVIMKYRISETTLFVCALLLGGSLVQGQHRSSSSIPSGTPITVRINEDLSSETARTGDAFTGVLAQPMVVNGSTRFPRGAAVSGQVLSAKKSGRLSDPGVLELTLISINGISVSSQPFLIKGHSHTKSNIVKIGGGTAAGAIIGGIAGGGKGAAIGAGVGAGAGTATAAATGKKPAAVESEAVLQFVSGGSPIRTSGSRTGSDSYSDGYADRPRGRHGHGHDSDDADDDDDEDDNGRASRRDGGYTFSDRDRDILNGCLSGYDFESLPPGIQKKLARGGSLPPGQAKKLHALPDSCNARLPRLPRNVGRIIFGDRVIILEAGSRILDMLTFER